jgi:hypothetical protein
MHCGMSSILTQLELSSFDMKLIILAKFWIWNGTHSNNIIHVHEFSALPLVFFLFAINIVGLQQIIFKNTKDGWAPGFVGT